MNTDKITTAAIATGAMKQYDLGASTTEFFVAKMHEWAVELREDFPELSARLAAVELRP